jgi:hypothetical protein
MDEEQIALIATHVFQRTRPLQRLHIPVDGRMRIHPTRHDHVDEAHSGPAGHSVGERQRHERIDVELGQQRRARVTATCSIPALGLGGEE